MVRLSFKNGVNRTSIRTLVSFSFLINDLANVECEHDPCTSSCRLYVSHKWYTVCNEIYEEL